jgi:DNA-directed RNA polymerase subunit H
LTNKVFPKHEVLNEEEAKKILDKYKVSIDELPRISKQDPALKGLEINIGDVIKIIRKSQTAGETVYYRAVIN